MYYKYQSIHRNSLKTATQTTGNKDGCLWRGKLGSRELRLGQGVTLHFFLTISEYTVSIMSKYYLLKKEVLSVVTFLFLLQTLKVFPPPPICHIAFYPTEKVQRSRGQVFPLIQHSELQDIMSYQVRYQGKVPLTVGAVPVTMTDTDPRQLIQSISLNISFDLLLEPQVQKTNQWCCPWNDNIKNLSSHQYKSVPSQRLPNFNHQY